MNKCLNHFRRGLLWPITLTNNAISCIVGITNPRDACVFSFSYIPRAFLEHNHGKFRTWFDTTDFGWYWKSSNYLNNHKIKRSKALQWLLRFRWLFIIPTEFLHCLVETDWCSKEWKLVTTAHLRYIWKVLKDGNYDSREDY